MKCFVALSLLAISAIAACAHIPPPADKWGEPVEGAQLRIALAKRLPAGWQPPLPDRLLKVMPVVELQIRNRGSTSITIDPSGLYCPSTEIDEVWYGSLCVFTGGGADLPMNIAPGSMGRVFFTRPNPNVVLNSQLVNMIEFFELPPGSHGVRLKIYARVQNSKSRKGTDTTDGRFLTLISNRITIDIPASTTAQIKP